MNLKKIRRYIKRFAIWRNLKRKLKKYKQMGKKCKVVKNGKMRGEMNSN